MPHSPFDPRQTERYEKWRRQKLADYPVDLASLRVQIGDLGHITPAEKNHLKQRLQRCNMVIYQSNGTDHATPEALLALGRQLGLHTLDRNALADETGLSSLRQDQGSQHGNFIPYSSRALQWHTDGYYNEPERQIRSVILHCVQPAGSGGENQLLDHEMLYLLLRDRNPAYVEALMAPDVMQIPAREEAGQVVRAAQTGPVFSILPDGNLHMRYTIRKHHIVWKNDPLTQAALAQIKQILHADSPYIFRVKLAAGMGIISNNVLHNRSAFEDDTGQPRHLLRARYLERVYFD